MSSSSTLDIKTTTRIETVDITSLVRGIIKQRGIQFGLCCVFCPHTTAGVTIQENADPTVKSDLMQHLSRLIPKDAPFAHGEGNSDSHIKSSVVGASTTLVVENGKLLLGHWQAIYFCEFDGPRERRVHVKIVGG